MAVVVAVVAAAGLTACSDGEASTPGATVPETLPETTTTTIDVTVVPDEITVAYADAVMDELDRLLGDAIRELVRARGPNERFYNLLNAVYDDPSFENKQSVWGEIAAEDFAGIEEQPGDPLTLVVDVLERRDDCLLLRVDRDFAPVLKDPLPERTTGYIALVPRQPSEDPVGANPTAWSIVFDGDTLDGAPPKDAC